MYFGVIVKVIKVGPKTALGGTLILFDIHHLSRPEINPGKEILYPLKSVCIYGKVLDYCLQLKKVSL